VLLRGLDGRSTHHGGDARVRRDRRSWQHHGVCIVNGAGDRVEEVTVTHSKAGLVKVAAVLRDHGVDRVGIERGDGPVVEHLIRSGFEVVVISSRQVRSLRARYGAAGNKDDRFDGLFSQLDIPISLAFLRRFPSEAKAAWLSPVRMAHWLRANGCCGRQTPDELVAHLRQAVVGHVHGPAAEAGEVIVTALVDLVDLLTTLRAQQDNLEARIKEALLAHPDGPIFRSLPRAGTVRAATLLAEIGDCRARFPDAQAGLDQNPVAPPARPHARQSRPTAASTTSPRRPLDIGLSVHAGQPLGVDRDEPRHPGGGDGAQREVARLGAVEADVLVDGPVRAVRQRHAARAVDRHPPRRVLADLPDRHVRGACVRLRAAHARADGLGARVLPRRGRGGCGTHRSRA